MKKPKLPLLLAGLLLAASAQAQSPSDQQAIKQLCGCFAVTFNYAETFSTDTVTKHFAKPRKTASVVEYAFPIEESPQKIVIQHLLVIPNGKGTVIKHWREDWEYEQTSWWNFTNDQEWTKVTVPKAAVKGQWVQTVWEVDDAPRYAGSSNWVNTNNQLFWLNTTDAPLPRREFTKRSDYNILQRSNKIVFTGQGYNHEQDNLKILRNPGKVDQLIAEEKGFNTYIRLADADCAQARKYWSVAAQDFWTDTREAWSLLMQDAKRIKLHKKVNGLLLYQALDGLYEQNLTGVKRKEALLKMIGTYIEREV